MAAEEIPNSDSGFLLTLKHGLMSLGWDGLITARGPRRGEKNRRVVQKDNRGSS